MSPTDKSEGLFNTKVHEGEEYAFEINFLKCCEPLSRYSWKFVYSRGLLKKSCKRFLSVFVATE